MAEQLRIRDQDRFPAQEHIQVARPIRPKEVIQEHQVIQARPVIQPEGRIRRTTCLTTRIMVLVVKPLAAWHSATKLLETDLFGEYGEVCCNAAFSLAHFTRAFCKWRIC